jgi:hypothetical protein
MAPGCPHDAPVAPRNTRRVRFAMPPRRRHNSFVTHRRQVTSRPRAVHREDALTYGSAGTRLRRGPAPADSAGPAAGDWLSGRAPRSHRGGHWFDPSIAHRCKARSETPLTALILLGGWEQSPYWEESGRSCSPARVADCERTDRDRRDQLHKTEETYTGTLIEITVVRNPARMTRMFYAQAAMRGSSAEHRPGFTGFRRGGYGGRGGAEVAECLHVVADGAIAATVAAVAELGVQPPDVGAALVPPLVQVRLVVIQQRRPAVHGLGQQLVNGLGTVEAADGFLGQAGAAHYRLDAQALRAQRLYLLIPFPCPPDQRGVRR